MIAYCDETRWRLVDHGRTMIFCTLFNQAYLPQGIALYRSLERTAKSGFLLYVLCMDRQTAAVLTRLDFERMKIIQLDEIEDDVMKSLKMKRGVGEYCFTCTSPLLLHILEKTDPGTVVTYVDADIAFLSDPSAIIQELGSGSIYIHEHDFAPRYANLASVSGRFNVGVSCFRNDAQGRACLQLWKSQCFEECVMDFSAGKCGDQNYLDEWPDLYSALVVSANPGVGLGPWNVEKRQIESMNGTVLAVGHAAVFYHYHSLRLLLPRWRVRATWLCGWFEIPDAAVRAFYLPYAQELWRAVDDIEMNGLLMTFGRFPERSAEMPYHQVLLSAGRISFPTSWSSKMFDLIASGFAKGA
jgi:hypothetical protein